MSALLHRHAPFVAARRLEYEVPKNGVHRAVYTPLDGESERCVIVRSGSVCGDKRGA